MSLPANFFGNGVPAAAGIDTFEAYTPDRWRSNAGAAPWWIAEEHDVPGYNAGLDRWQVNGGPDAWWQAPGWQPPTRKGLLLAGPSSANPPQGTAVNGEGFAQYARIPPPNPPYLLNTVGGGFSVARFVGANTGINHWAAAQCVLGYIDTGIVGPAARVDPATNSAYYVAPTLTGYGDFYNTLYRRVNGVDTALGDFNGWPLFNQDGGFWLIEVDGDDPTVTIRVTRFAGGNAAHPYLVPPYYARWPDDIYVSGGMAYQGDVLYTITDSSSARLKTGGPGLAYQLPTLASGSYWSGWINPWGGIFDFVCGSRLSAQVIQPSGPTIIGGGRQVGSIVTVT